MPLPLVPRSKREALANWPMALLTLVSVVVVAVTVAFSLGH